MRTGISQHILYNILSFCQVKVCNFLLIFFFFWLYCQQQSKGSLSWKTEQPPKCLFIFISFIQMKHTTNFFESIGEFQAPQKKKILTCQNWELWINEDKVLSFKFEKSENSELIKKLNWEIEELEKQLETADLYEKVLIHWNISKLEKRIQKESTWWLKNWWLICKLDSWSLLEQVKDLAMKADTDNIRSVLYMLWVEFWNDFWQNNLWKILTDKQLDNMSMSEATSYSQMRNLPRNWENILD